MREYSQFNPITGQILCSGVCDENTFNVMPNVLPVRLNNSKYYISDNHIITEFPTKPSDYHEWDWENKQWILPEKAINQAKLDKINELNKLCKSSIISGFTSSALGEDYHYPSKEIDQANLNASVTASLYPYLESTWTTPFWCEHNGEWAYHNHTAQQIQQVGQDGKVAILAHLNKNAQLRIQIENASTLDEINKINW